MKIAQTVGPLNKGVTISVQSLNDDTLDAIKRKNLAINDMKEIFNLAEVYQVKTYSEFIIGLPKETLDSWKAGLTDILESGQHQSIDVWFCQVLKNSELGSFMTKQQFGIKTISVKDYLALNNNLNEEVAEYIDIITETNTMSLDDIIEGYMYAWMIIHFHIAGFSQVLAKDARQHNISFRQFYDHLFESIKTSEFADHYNALRSCVEKYLTTGVSSFKNGHSAIHTFSAEYLYENKNKIFDLAYATYTNLTNNNDPNQLDLQKAFIYDDLVEYPFSLTANGITYKIETQIKDSFNFYTSRRKGLLKNILTPMTQH